MNKILLYIGLCIMLLSSFTTANDITDYLNNNIVAYYNFDSNADDDVSGFNGTVVGATNQGTNCILNNCYDFDGDDDYIKVLEEDDLVSDFISLSFWFYPRDMDTDQEIIRQWDTGKMYIVEFRGATNDSIFSNALDSTPAGSSTLSIDTLYHYVITANLTTQTITTYKNGVLTNSFVDATMLTTTKDDLYFGIFSDTNLIRDFNGTLDEIAIFNKDIPIEYVQWLYNSGNIDSDQQYPFSETTPINNSPLLVNLVYPINNTIFNGDYNGSIILDVTDYNQTINCSVNDTRWNSVIVGGDFCYQEFVNESTACGGLNTGNTDISLASSSLFVDGDYDTFSFSSGFNTLSYAYINYTIPAGAGSQSLLQVKDGNGIFNTTIPSSCYSGNSLSFRYSVWRGNPTQDYTVLECHNTVDYVFMYNRTGSTMFWFYEEAMFWKFNEVNTTITLINNTPIIDQVINLEYTCTDIEQSVSAKFTFILNTTLTITFYDEQTDLPLNINGELAIISNTFSTNITVNNQSSLFASLEPNNYEIRYDAEGYHRRIYYLNLLGGESDSINLYLINNSVDISTQILHNVLDQDGDPANNLTIKLQRNYINNNVSVFKTVSMRRTNFEGQAIFYVQLYDYFYKLIYEKSDGTIVEISEPAPFLVLNPIEQVNLLEDPYFSLREYDNTLYNLSYINESGVEFFRFFYSDTNNLVAEGCLNVQRITSKEYIDVCYICAESPSATLSCLIDTTLDGQYKAVGLIDTNTETSWYALDTLYYEDLSEVSYGQEGLFWSTILIGSMVLMGLGSFTANILFLILGLVVMAITGFVTGFNIGFIYWIILLSFIVLFMITYSRKGKQ